MKLALAVVSAITPAAAPKCFMTQQITGHAIANERTLYLRVGAKSGYRVEMSDNCFGGANPLRPDHHRAARLFQCLRRTGSERGRDAERRRPELALHRRQAHEAHPGRSRRSAEGRETLAISPGRAGFRGEA